MREIPQNTLIRIYRPKVTDDYIDGFVVGMGPEFIIIHNFDQENVMLKGYAVIRIEDIGKYTVFDDEECFFLKALQLRKQIPRPVPNIKLTDYYELFHSIDINQYPLIAIEREKLDDTICFIGKIFKITKNTITLKKIGSNGRWIDKGRYNLFDITKIGFGGGYVEALWLVANKKQALRRKEK